MRLHSTSGSSVADVDTVDEDGTAGHVEQARDEVQQRGLAGARTADDRRRASRTGGEGHAAEHGELGTGVVERDLAKLDVPTHDDVGDRILRRGDRRLRGQHLADAVGGHRRTRRQHRHERGHHHRHEDLHQVAEEGSERADLQRPVVHRAGAEPQHGHARHVEHEHHRREHQGHPLTDPDGGVGELVVGRGEAGRLTVLADERPDHPDPGDLLAQHPVDVVGALLHLPEARDHPADDEGHGEDQRRHADEQQP